MSQRSRATAFLACTAFFASLAPAAQAGSPVGRWDCSSGSLIHTFVLYPDGSLADETHQRDGSNTADRYATYKRGYWRTLADTVVITVTGGKMCVKDHPCFEDPSSYEWAMRLSGDKRQLTITKPVTAQGKSCRYKG